MADSNDVQTLERISTEVDESQFKIILSSQCIKAQAYLINKLRKQSEQQKQICYFISKGNLKFEAEIKIADQEVKSLYNALDTIKVANVELKKELLIAKEKKIAITERVDKGIKKYDELWMVSKKRYESIPIIQNYLQAKSQSKTLQENILNLTNETQKISNDINIRKRELLNLDRKFILELAKFMVCERPQILKSIKEKSNEVDELSNEIQNITKEYGTIATTTSPVLYEQPNENESKDVFTEESWSSLTTGIDDTLVLPNLQLQNIDLDIIAMKLDKIKKVDFQNVSNRNESEQMLTLVHIPIKKINLDEMLKDAYIFSYFQPPKNLANMEVTDPQTKSYSEKKLIHILEDVKLDSETTYNMVSNVKPSSLQDVHVIGADIQKDRFITKQCSQEKVPPQKDSQKIELIDLTQNRSSNILQTIIPLTEFLDLSVNSQERKDTSNSVSLIKSEEMSIDLDKSHEDDISSNDNKINQLDVSTASDDSYVKIKELIFKKRNLDRSPQFTFSKTSTLSMRPETNVQVSKFFEKAANNILDDTNKVQVMEVVPIDPFEKKANKHLDDQQLNCENKSKMDTENNYIEDRQKDIPLDGFVFSHGPQGIPDTLNVSTSTVGFEDADGDYPPYIDTSLLLSPKAEDQFPETSNNVVSQEVPNFLSGNRKTGFSFFEKQSENNNLNNSEQNPRNNNAFSFGGNENKGRGGFFSMFH